MRRGRALAGSIDARSIPHALDRADQRARPVRNGAYHYVLPIGVTGT